VLISKEKYDEVLQLSKNTKLQEMIAEKGQLCTITWSVSLSKYMEGKINSTRLLEDLRTIEVIIISESRGI
jgi:biotin carboxylase